MERAGVKAERINMVLVGLSETDLGPAVLGTVPAEAALDDPAFQMLADRLKRFNTSLKGDEQND
jgi:hypothetical protein